MVEEVFDDGEQLRRAPQAMLEMLMNGTGTLRYVYKEDGSLKVEVAPIEVMQHPAPKDTQ